MFDGPPDPPPRPPLQPAGLAPPVPRPFHPHLTTEPLPSASAEGIQHMVAVLKEDERKLQIMQRGYVRTQDGRR